LAELDEFGGFTKDTFKFLRNLEKNNTKEWFEDHRETYEEKVFQPSLSFISGMGERLSSIAPDIVAIPKTDKSIFRIYKDIRFSKDKTPYKTHVGIFFWEGKRKKLENPGFYLQLNKSSIYIASGLYIFPNDLLKPYRDSVVHPRRGAELTSIIKKITKSPSYKVGDAHYKRVPRGYDPEHPNAELLLYNGIHAYCESSIPEEIYSSQFVEYCYKIFKDFSPLHTWLQSYIK
jgi:uncharacterized protein (TIGR02453 family)